MSAYSWTWAAGSLSHRLPSVLIAREMAGRTINTAGVGISATYVNMQPMLRRRRPVNCILSSPHFSSRLPPESGHRFESGQYRVDYLEDVLVPIAIVRARGAGRVDRVRLIIEREQQDVHPHGGPIAHVIELPERA